MEPVDSTRPPWEYSGPYNVRRTDLHEYTGTIWVTSGEIPELSLDEFFDVQVRVCAVLYRLRVVDDEFAQSDTFFVWDDNFFDRTVRMEYFHRPLLATELPVVVASLQECLSKSPLWRVFMTSHVTEHSIWIYPEDVRTAMDGENISLHEKLGRIARDMAAEKPHDNTA